MRIYGHVKDVLLDWEDHGVLTGIGFELVGGKRLGFRLSKKQFDQLCDELTKIRERRK